MMPPKANIGVGKASESPPRETQVPPKATSLIQVFLGGACIIHLVGFMPQVKVQVTLCLHDQVVTYQRPAKTSKYALQGSKSHNIMPSKPYIINELPKHVHQIPPFQNKHMLKDLIQFGKFRYGRGVIVPYWVNQFLK
jgi:hypothetical protein